MAEVDLDELERLEREAEHGPVHASGRMVRFGETLGGVGSELPHDANASFAVPANARFYAFMLNNAAAIISELRELRAAVRTARSGAARWIPVGERMPESYVPVATWVLDTKINHKTVDTDYMIKPVNAPRPVWRLASGDRRLRVLAWMPLPKPPSLATDGGTGDGE